MPPRFQSGESVRNHVTGIQQWHDSDKALLPLLVSPIPPQTLEFSSHWTTENAQVCSAFLQAAWSGVPPAESIPLDQLDFQDVSIGLLLALFNTDDGISQYYAGKLACPAFKKVKTDSEAQEKKAEKVQVLTVWLSQSIFTEHSQLSKSTGPTPTCTPQQSVPSTPLHSVPSTQQPSSAVLPVRLQMDMPEISFADDNSSGRVIAVSTEKPGVRTSKEKALAQLAVTAPVPHTNNTRTPRVWSAKQKAHSSDPQQNL
eukprot:2190603-Rhodomonas_salina.1